jgi:hypothetical protein
MESASVKAATDCVAAAALNNSEITTLYRENRLKEVTNWVVLRSSTCDNPLKAMRLLHDRIYGQGTGRTFLRGDYLDDLPRAVAERIKVEVLRRTARSSGEIRDSNAMVPREATAPPPSGNATLPGVMAPAQKPISKGTELRVVQVGANDVLRMRKDAMDDSPVVDTIPPNGKRHRLFRRNTGSMDIRSIRPIQRLGESSFRVARRKSGWTYPVMPETRFQPRYLR